jgi:hypothetical protein
VVLTLDRVRRFELQAGESVQSLITLSLRSGGNPDGYGLYRDGAVLATLCRTLGGLGLRHVGFHTMLWSPLPLAVESPTDVDIRVVSSPAEVDAHIDIQLSVYGVPPAIIDRLRPLRRTWFGSSGRRHYLAYVDGQPAAQACLSWRDDVAYLESAGTLYAYRNRGLQRALIRRRVLDAAALGCRTLIGGADFESQSRTNQLACGLSVAYLAAQWVQRPEAVQATRAQE